MSDTKIHNNNNLRNENTIGESAMLRRANRRKNRGGDDTADWSECNPDLVVGLIAIVGLNKGTITLGYTRDGGAYYISYYFGLESEKVYCRPTEDIDTFLEYEIKSFEA